MAEALLTKISGSRIQGLSAGSDPTGKVHPIALTCLQHNRIPVQKPRSKSWDEFIDEPIDLVITVCDNAAGETCPVFPGNPPKLHWGLPDPAKATGEPDEIFAEFQAVYEQLHALISTLVAGLDTEPHANVGDWLTNVNFETLLAANAANR